MSCCGRRPYRVLPVRVYQVLYTGYWFWGNFLTPRFIPRLSDTILTPAGRFIAGGFFMVDFGAASSSHRAFEAVMSLAALMACAAIALLALERYLAWQQRCA